jgi:hypothetical protein
VAHAIQKRSREDAIVVEGERHCKSDLLRLRIGLPSTSPCTPRLAEDEVDQRQDDVLCARSDAHRQGTANVTPDFLDTDI